ncbi:MAG TPA: glycosyltransferase family 39 protein [Elusimicrobiota bacterium]|nr:glycosyltransferase family 39 protein [Elusimicrobiota bacterium]
MKRIPAIRILALGALLAAGVYLPRLGAPLAWDDLPYIAFNPALRRPIPPSAYFRPAYFEVSREATWRPLATWTYAAMLRAFGERPWALRLPGFLLHLACGLLAFLLLRELGSPDGAAAWAAALFLVHPVHVETVMCVSFNEDLLVCAGLLGMLLAHARGRTVLAGALYAAAMLSKETGILGLPLAALLDRESRRPWRARRGSYAAYAILAASYLRLRLGPLAGPSEGPALALPLWERALQAAKALAVSLRVLALPVGLRIEYFALPPRPADLLAPAALAALAGAAALLVRRRPAPDERFAFAWPWPFLAAVSPLLPAGVLNLRLLAERFLYAPCLGFSALAARRLRPETLAVLLLAWTCLGARRAADWSREERLWEGLAEIYPRSAKAEEGLGEAYLRAGDPARAAQALEKARALREERADPILRRYAPLTPELPWDKASVYRSLGLCYADLGEEARAEPLLRRALELDPAAPSAHAALAYAAARLGRFDEARSWAERGLERFPGDPLLLRLLESARERRLSFRARFS